MKDLSPREVVTLLTVVSYAEVAKHSELSHRFRLRLLPHVGALDAALGRLDEQQFETELLNMVDEILGGAE